MYDLEPPTHAQRWRGYSSPDGDSAAIAECEAMAQAAEENEAYQNRCLAGEKVFYLDYYKGLMPGHIYSEAGKDEFGISRACEYHFDEWMQPDEDEE